MAAAAHASADCPLCAADGGRLVLRTPQFRLVHAEEAGFPGFYRLVWNAHVAELSDLPPADRALMFEALVRAEAALRTHLRPTKVNLSSLGNMVPHLHWHLVARFDWDSHFPAPLWAQPLRQAPADRLAAVEAALPALEDDLRAALSDLR